MEYTGTQSNNGVSEAHWKRSPKLPEIDSSDIVYPDFMKDSFQNGQRNHIPHTTPATASYQTPISPGVRAPELAGPYLMHNDRSGRPFSPSSGNSALNSPDTHSFSFVEKAEITRKTTTGTHPHTSRICGLSMRRFWIIIPILLICVVVVGVGLGIGLWIGLKQKDPNVEIGDEYCLEHSKLCIGGSLDATFYSKQGAFNGSGIALAGEAWNKDSQTFFTLYFQHWTGDIRLKKYTRDKGWIGGGRETTVATDAKNATPISTVSYSFNQTQVFHVFYISKDNFLRQVTQTNISSSAIWEPGALSKLNLTVFDAPNVGLQACWKGNFYGDSDYTKFPTPSGEQNRVPFDNALGINIWYPIDESTFQQYAWYQGYDDWFALDKWTGKNAHAGVGCYSWGEGTTTYTMMANKGNNVEFWWKDTNTTLTSTEDHPVKAWRNSTNGTIPDVHPLTSLGYTTYFYVQMADRTIKGFNITYQAENTTIVPEDTFTITSPGGPAYGVGGTHFTVTSVSDKTDEGEELWNSLYVFYQTEGDDISAFTRPIEGGEWSQGKLVIPLE